MAESVGTVHLSISADLDTLEARLKQRLGVVGKQLGQQLGQDLGREATRGIEQSMAAVSKTAFTPLEQSAKSAGRRISDNLDVSVKTDKARAQLDSLAKQKRIVELTAEANTRQAEAKLAEFDSRENQLRVDVDANVEGAKAKLDTLLSERKTFEIQVEAQTLRAREQLDRLDEKRTVVIQAEAETGGARAKLDELSKSASGAGFGLNGLGLATAVGVASMGTLIPVAVAATGAVLALGVAAAGVGSAFGVAKLAFSGVGTALTALDAQQSKAGEDAAKAAAAALSMANAQDALKSAVQGVADARTQAAQATEQASRRVSDAVQSVQLAEATAAQNTITAERTLRQAQMDELQAQKDLTQAREDATRQLQDMSARAADATLSERQANLDLISAKQELAKVVANPRSTQLEIQQAILRRDMAQQSATEAHTAAQRAVTDNQKAQQSGVEGSAAVVGAKQKIKDANDKVHQSEVDLTNTRADGARNVTKAQRDLADARKNEADVAQKNAESIARAEQGVVQAQRGIQAALMATQAVGATTRNAVNEAFQDLSPAAKHFALFIFGLKDDLDGLRAAASESLLPPLEKAIKILLPYLPQVEKFVGSVGRAVGDVAIKIAQALTGPEWKAFFSAIRDQAPGDIRKIGDMFVSVGKVIAKVFTAAAPYAKPILDGIKGFFDRIDQKATPGRLKHLFDGIMPTLAAVWNVVSAVGRVLWSIISNGSGSQGGAADTLNKVAGAINKLATAIDKHPEMVSQLMGLATALVAIRAANPVVGVIGSIGSALGGFSTFGINAWKIGSKLFAAGGLFGVGGMMSTALEAIGGVIAAITAPVWIVIGVIALLVGAFVLAYFKIKWFHDGVNAIVHAIGQFFVWLWQNALSPALHAIGAVFEWLYNNVISPVWQLIKLVIDIAWASIQVTFGLIKIGIKIWSAIWNWLYDHVIHPVWTWIADHIAAVWNKDIKPILDVVSSYIEKNVAPKFQSAVGVIAEIWTGIVEAFKTPIRFLIQTVLDDGLLAAYNWVAKKFHVTPDNVHIDVPPFLQAGGGSGQSSGSSAPPRRGRSIAMATGGSVFGPGTGTSDSIPALLSNGEHVWTAREVRAAGGHDVVEAIRSAVLQSGAPGFAGGGGVWNWITDKISSAGGWVWNSAKNLASLASDFVSNPLGVLTRVATAALDKLPGGRDGLLSKVMVGATKTIAGGVADFAKGLFGFGGGGGGSVGPVPGGGGVSRWRPMVLKALAQLGLSPSLADRVLRQINTESGGNPSVIQQVHDVNWPNNRAQGLLQVIPSTFRAYHVPGTSNNELDAWANIMASLNYARHVYGPDLSGMGMGHGYDSGGWLMPGTQIVHNDTGRPEAVFSPSQWATLEANLAGALGDGGDYSKTTNVDVHTYGDPNAIATAIAAAQERADLLDAISL